MFLILNNNNRHWLSSQDPSTSLNALQVVTQLTIKLYEFNFIINVTKRLICQGINIRVSAKSGFKSTHWGSRDPAPNFHWVFIWPFNGQSQRIYFLSVTVLGLGTKEWIKHNFSFQIICCLMKGEKKSDANFISDIFTKSVKQGMLIYWGVWHLNGVSYKLLRFYYILSFKEMLWNSSIIID